MTTGDKMNTRRDFISAVSAAPLLLAVSAPATHAQARYPNKPIRWIIPNTAGSPNDVIARKLAEPLGQDLGVPVIVENKPGASQTIGAAEVARSAPDGYTFMFSIADPLVGALATVKSLPYNPRKDFTFITKVGAASAVLVANPSVKANNLVELIAQSKAANTPLSFGSWGPGTFPSQIMTELSQKAGVKFIEVAYKGSVPAMQDVMGGHVSLTYLAAFLAAPLAAQGKLKILANPAPRRSPLAPNAPTFAESGYNSFIFNYQLWVGLTGPAGMDTAIRDRMAQAIQKALRDPGFIKFMGDIGFTVIGSTPAEFESDYRAEVEVVPKLIRESGVVPE